jgi:serine phosphatase RsbU (regulator of sigma subunit)
MAGNAERPSAVDRLARTGPVGALLLVEDDDGDAFLVSELLDEAGPGLELRRARSLRDGLAAVGPDVACVLLDLNLPDTAGMPALREMLAASDAAVIVLTGLTDREAGVAAVAHGAQDYLVKDEVDGELLLRAIRYAIERHQVARRLAEEQLARERNERIERGLLPRPLVDDPRVRWAMRYLPGGGESQLGGDFLDAVQREDGSVRAVIGDVCGHGPDEAAIGASLRIAWRTLVLARLDDDEVLPSLERILEVERADPFLFATVCDVTVSPDRLRVSTRLAGHPAPLVVDRRTRPVVARHRGRPLGVPLGDGRWPAAQEDVDADAALLLYTDGLIEGRTEGRRLLGVEGLIELVRARPIGEDPDGFLEALIDGVGLHNGGPVSDDAACLLLAHAPR